MHRLLVLLQGALTLLSPALASYSTADKSLGADKPTAHMGDLPHIDLSIMVVH